MDKDSEKRATHRQERQAGWGDTMPSRTGVSMTDINHIQMTVQVVEGPFAPRFFPYLCTTTKTSH